MDPNTTQSAAAPPATHCTQCGAVHACAATFCSRCGHRSGAAPTTPEVGLAALGTCTQCAGAGRKLASEVLYCRTCRWLRPLGPVYELRPDAFLWRLDAEAMGRLRALGPITALAQTISEKYGKPWFEASVNGVRLSERQLPEIFSLAVFAARIVGLSRMPEIYISGESMWETKTLGSDQGAFVVLGSVLTNFRGEDLLFLLAREMGHVRAGHALWRTVYELVAGRHHGQRTMLGDGVAQWINPAKMIESAIEAPLMAWARHSEITADRAGQIALGKIEPVRRVLLQWNLKSLPLYQRLNLDDWIEQEAEGDRAAVNVAEFALSSSPYIARRLRLARDFQAGQELAGWRRLIEHWLLRDPSWLKLAASWDPQRTNLAKSNEAAAPTVQATDADSVRLVCSACAKPMLLKRSQIPPDRAVNVRCPNPACAKVLSISVRSTAAAAPQSLTPEDTTAG